MGGWLFVSFVVAGALVRWIARICWFSFWSTVQLQVIFFISFFVYYLSGDILSLDLFLFYLHAILFEWFYIHYVKENVEAGYIFAMHYLKCINIFPCIW